MILGEGQDCKENKASASRRVELLDPRISETLRQTVTLRLQFGDPHSESEDSNEAPKVVFTRRGKVSARKKRSDLRARNDALEHERLGDPLLQGFPTVAAYLRDAPTARKERSDLRARKSVLENERLGDTLLQIPPRCNPSGLISE